MAPDTESYSWHQIYHWYFTLSILYVAETVDNFPYSSCREWSQPRMPIEIPCQPTSHAIQITPAKAIWQERKYAILSGGSSGGGGAQQVPPKIGLAMGFNPILNQNA